MPIALTILAPAPIKILFCDSVSVRITASTRTKPVTGFYVGDLDLDRVRNLLSGPPQDLLAHQLGDQDLPRLVGVLAPLEVERTRRQQAGERFEQLGNAFRGPRRDGKDVVGDAELACLL